MQPETRFCTSADGTRIADTTLGDGPPLLFVSGVMSVNLHWEHPIARSFLARLAEGRQLAWTASRGYGAGEREVGVVSLEAQVADLEAITDALPAVPLDLLASDEGAA